MIGCLDNSMNVLVFLINLTELCFFSVKKPQFPVAVLLDTASHKAVRATTLHVSVMIKFIFICPKFLSSTREATIYVTHPPHLSLYRFLFSFPFSVSLSLLFVNLSAGPSNPSYCQHHFMSELDSAFTFRLRRHLQLDKKTVRDHPILSIVILDKWEQQSFQGPIVFCVTSL